MKKNIRTAVIGVGSMGTNHARVYSEISNLVAVSDINEATGKHLADKYNVHYYKNYQEMLIKEKPDAVSVVVPTIYHKHVAIDCLNRKIPTLVEKPLASTLEETQEINEAVKKTKTFLLVGHIERFNPAVLKLKELLEKGILGQIVSINIKRVGLYPPRIKDVNVVTDIASHDLDIACCLLEKFPRSIFATGGNGLKISHIDYADILLEFDGISCYIQANWMTPIKIRTLSITGTLGYGELDYINQKLILYKSNIETITPHTYKNFVANLSKHKKIYPKIQKKEPLKLELYDFLEAISKKRNPSVTVEQGIRVVRLTELVLKSIIQKKLIRI